MVRFLIFFFIATQVGLANAQTHFATPEPLGAEHYPTERVRMVDEYLMDPELGAPPVRDPKVLGAMRIVPRHVFVRPVYQPVAYSNEPLPIGHDQTISQPYIVGMMTELLEVKPGMKVLEIGTGSGYQTAVLAHLTPHVYTIEIIEEFSQKAQRILTEQGYKGIKFRVGDGYLGWPEEAPFDGIIVTCAAPEVPKALIDQLKPNSRMVIPVEAVGGHQELLVVHKLLGGIVQTNSVMNVRFVKMQRSKQ